MKRALIALALLAFTPMIALSAAAKSSSLPGWIETEAKRLSGEVTKAKRTAALLPSLKAPDVSSKLTEDLQRFGLQASRLSAEINKAAGAVDLRCIFRGMAEEADGQLKALAAAKTGGAQAAAYSRLDAMLKDAAEIAPAADKLLGGDKSVAHPLDAPMASYVAKGCPAKKP